MTTGRYIKSFSLIMGLLALSSESTFARLSDSRKNLSDADRDVLVSNIRLVRANVLNSVEKLAADLERLGFLKKGADPKVLKKLAGECPVTLVQFKLGDTMSSAYFADEQSANAFMWLCAKAGVEHSEPTPITTHVFAPSAGK